MLAATLILAACTKEEYTYSNPASQLEVSSTYVVFSPSGGSKTVVVAGNVDWTCAGDANWFTVSRTDDNSLSITAGSNTDSANRYGTVTVSGGSLSATVSVGQTASDGEDLSASETANCYIAHTGTTYRFDATVKGNGLASNVSSVSAYASKYGLTISDTEIMRADLLWEAVPDADRTRSCDIISGDPLYSDGYVSFTTGSSEGNAVIAVKNSANEVLWSWHIWVTDADLEELSGNGYHWMDRNLGALTAEPGDLSNRGLLYQWGRKDPFLDASSEYGATTETNYQVGNGTGVWNLTDYVTNEADEAPGNIDNAVKNPMSFFLPAGSAVYHWYLSWTNDDAYYSYLWGDSSDLSKYEKTVFDPCPPGYNVPVTDAFYSETDADVNVWALADYGVYWTGGGSAFFPCAGFIEAVTGVLSYVGSYGYYWTSAIYDGTYYGECMYFNSKTVYYDSYGPPSYAFPIRCMRAE